MQEKSAEPCPNCGSKEVRWRQRRFYDGPLNFIETMLTGGTVRGNMDGVGAMERSYMDASFARRQDIGEQKKKMGRRTADRFWRCPACKLSGESHDDSRM